MQQIFAYRGRTKTAFVLFVALIGVTAAFVGAVSWTDVFADHTTHNDPVIHGLVVDANNAPVPNVAVKNCWDSSVQQPANCAFPSQVGYTDANGHWAYRNPATGYHHFFTVSPASTNSAPLFYDFSSTNNRVQVPNLTVPAGSTQNWTLYVNVSGAGTVTSSPAGINCGSMGTGACSLGLSNGTSVTLSAQPDTTQGTTFSSWSGDCTGIAMACTLTMNSGKNVTANFSGSGGDGNVPAAPSNLRLEPAPSTTAIYLKWNDNATNEDKFNVERSPASQNTWASLMQLGANTTAYTDNSVVSGTPYDYRVQACLSGYGCSAYAYLTQVSTSGTSTVAKRLWGYVKQNGTPVSGTDVRYCTSSVPEPFPSCNFTAVGPSDSNGMWQLLNPAANLYYRFWVDTTGTAYAPSNSLNQWYQGGEVFVGEILLTTNQSGGTSGSISGTVYDNLKNPKSGVAIEVRQESSLSGTTGNAMWNATTGTDGRYTVENLPFGQYRIRAMPASGPAAPDQFRNLDSASSNVIVDFFLESAIDFPFAVSGTVKRSNGTAVGDAEVGAHRPADGTHRTARTSTTGAYSLSLSCGVWNLFVHPASSTATWRYNGMSVSVSFDCQATSGSKTVDFTVLETDAVLAGRVVMPDGSAPPADTMDVGIWRMGGEGFGDRVAADGSFTIRAQAGVYEIGIFPQDQTLMAPASLRSAELVSGQTVNYGTITLVRADASVSGRVAFADGAGVTGVRVFAHVPNGSGYRETKTDSSGAYSLMLSAGTWEIIAEVDASLKVVVADRPHRVDLVSGQTIFELNFSALRADATVTGRVVNEQGAVVSGVDLWVFAEQIDASTNARGGTFALALPAGSYQLNVWVAPEAGYFSRGSVAVTVASGQTVSVDLVLESAANGGRIEGRILDENGAVVKNTGLEVFAARDFKWVPGVYDSTTGAYRVSLPQGIWNLGYHVFSDAYGSNERMVGTFTLSVGQTITRDIVLKRNTATIAVTVLRSDGTPFPNADVEVTTVPFQSDNPEAFTGTFSRFARADAQGVARIGVSAGTYYVHAWAPFDLSGGIQPPEQQVAVIAGATVNVTMRFRVANATITGRAVLSATGEPVRDGFVGAWSPSGGFAEGRLQPDGTFRLQLSSGDIWNVGSEANINGVLHRSDMILVDLLQTSSADVTLQLRSTGFQVPAPKNASFDATAPFAAILDNGVAVSAPASALETSGTVSISILPDVAAPDLGSSQVIGMAYDVTAWRADGTLVQQLNGNIVISIPYDDVDVRAFGISETDLQLAFFDETSGRWERIGASAADSDANVVTGTADHLTRFAILTPAYSTVVAGTIREGDLIRGPDGVKVFIVNANGFKRHIFNPAVFGMYRHFTWESIKDVSQATLDSYATSDLYRADGDYRIYSLEEVDEAAGRAVKHHLDMAADRFTQIGYDWRQVFTVNAQERDYYETGSSIQ